MSVFSSGRENILIINRSLPKIGFSFYANIDIIITNNYDLYSVISTRLAIAKLFENKTKNNEEIGIIANQKQFATSCKRFDFIQCVYACVCVEHKM